MKKSGVLDSFASNGKQGSYGISFAVLIGVVHFLFVEVQRLFLAVHILTLCLFAC